MSPAAAQVTVLTFTFTSEKSVAAKPPSVAVALAVASADLASPCAHKALQARALLDFFTTLNSLPKLLLFSSLPNSSLAHLYTCLLPFPLISFLTSLLTYFPTAHPLLSGTFEHV